MKTIVLIISGVILMVASFVAGRSSNPRYELRMLEADAGHFVLEKHPIVVRINVAYGTMCVVNNGGKDLYVETVNGQYVEPCHIEWTGKPQGLKP